ncbi:MAG: 2-dehydro-3-deoxyphosphogluconate aldolase [Clostridiales bacterium]|nr:MAG: 2-dehydro-3-deoxyphosphogluconate aldolase [Clostridiales bacterium]
MYSSEQLFQIGLLPVVVLNNAAQAVPLAKALLAGGIPTAEITFRTDAAVESIRRISTQVPEMLVGAGTVTSVSMAEQAVAAGARYIVSPGLNTDVIRWCLAHEIPVFPGVATPTEVEQAMGMGLSILKFFPAEQCGGTAMLKALSGPYPQLRLIPTGGIGPQNLADYLALPNVLACGGSWMVPAALIEAGDFTAISALCRQAVDLLMGLRFAHLGINNADETEARRVAALFCALLGVSPDEKPASIFVGPQVEVIKYTFRGQNGHIAFFCSNIERAVFHLQQRGIAFNPESYEYDEKGCRVVYLAQEFGGFAIHLVRA